MGRTENQMEAPELQGGLYWEAAGNSIYSLVRSSVQTEHEHLVAWFEQQKLAKGLRHAVCRWRCQTYRKRGSFSGPAEVNLSGVKGDTVRNSRGFPWQQHYQTTKSSVLVLVVWFSRSLTFLTLTCLNCCLQFFSELQVSAVTRYYQVRSPVGVSD